MKIIKNNQYKNRKNNIFKIAFFVTFYSIIIFIAGAISHRNGFFRNNKWYFFPPSWILRENPILTIRNQLIPAKGLVIDISYKNISRIKRDREKAVTQKQLYSKDTNWVNAKISYGPEKYKAKIRLKGQLKDHWNNDGLWSYKIQLKGDKTFLGMDRFAIQHPRTRFFMNEWYFHKILNYAGLISLRYNFLPVSINGEKFPIYAVEENFSTRLLENNNKREGPIFRIQHRFSPEEPNVNEVTFYQKGKYESTQEGRFLMRRVERQIGKFFQEETKAKDVFNIEMMAKLFAISDLFGDDHSILTNNLTLYMNPINGLIEPVPYDQQVIQKTSIRGLIGERNKHYEHSSLSSDLYISKLFKDKDFSREYLDALNNFSKKTWLDNFFKSTEKDAEKNIRMLQKSYLSYDFSNKEVLYDNQKYIRNKLRERNPIEAYLIPSKKKNFLVIQLKNLHTLPIEIKSIENSNGEEIGINFKPKLISNKLKICTSNNCYKEITNKEKNLEYLKILIDDKFLLPGDLNQLNLVGKIVGSEIFFKVPVYSEIEYDLGLNNLKELKKVKFLTVNEDDKSIIFKKGFISLSKSIIIPEELTVSVLEGTTIDLLEGSSIISKSTLELLGSKDSPIIIKTSDETGEGIIVSNAMSTSKIQNVIFKKLKNHSKYGLNTTGAITFYNSDVLMDGVIFETINAEDSLNIVNSNFNIINSKFYNSLSDAIDIDFSDGIIKNVELINIGNDALDFSGSNSQIFNIKIQKSGDKGISVGENSNLEIKNIEINKSYIGLAIKDDSIIKGSKIKVQNSYVGIANYNKKSWFGGGNAQLNKVLILNSENKYFNEEGSFMNINNFQIIPNHKNLFNKLYIPED